MKSSEETFKEIMKESSFNDFIYSMIEPETINSIVNEVVETQLVHRMLRELLLIEVENQIDKLESAVAINRMDHPDAHQNIERIILLKEYYLHC